jgi:hypothetical protein
MVTSTTWSKTPLPPYWAFITFHLIMPMQKHQGGMQHDLAFVKESQFGGSIIHHTSYDHY